MLQTLIASDSKTVTNATHVRGQVGSRALIVPTHTNHLSTTCLPHVRLETRLPVGTKFREGWSLGTRLHATCMHYMLHLGGTVIRLSIVNLRCFIFFITRYQLSICLEQLCCLKEKLATNDLPFLVPSCLEKQLEDLKVASYFVCSV